MNVEKANPAAGPGSNVGAVSMTDSSGQIISTTTGNVNNFQERTRTSLPVTFTIFRSVNDILAKRYSPGENGTIVKTPAALMVRGTATRVTMDFTRYAAALMGIDEKTAYGYGTLDPAHGTEVQIVVDGKEDVQKHILSRTQKFFEYRRQSGVLMIDHDPHPRGKSVTPDELLETITDILPEFKDASAVWRGSISAGVHRQGEQPQPGRGFHAYVAVSSAADIPRFGAVLCKRLWLAGYGFIAISAAGTFLVRCIIDGVVFRPERLDFVGRPVIGEGLVWTPPEPVYRDGGYLDTSLLPDLTDEEESRYAALVAAAKADVEPERAKVRVEWIERQVARMTKRGTTEAKARETLRPIGTEGARFDLPEDFVLDFANLGTATVRDALANPGKFDRQPMSDPFEGPSYGRTTAMFYANLDGARPCINSNAHGGVRYLLPSSARLGQSHTDAWENPKPLPMALPAVAGFEYGLLPDRLEPWVRDTCERMGCPPDYVAVATIVALGAVIGRKVGIRPQSRTDWTVTANQWGLAVGRPGVLKSPAMEAAFAPVKRLVAKALEKYKESESEYSAKQRMTRLRAEASEKAAKRQLSKDIKSDISGLLIDQELEDPPVLKRYIANNTTAEALGELHRQNTNGLLVFRDEMVSLLKTLDREDSSEARGFYLTGWNGDSPYTFDRIGRGLNLHIPAVCLSLMGSTQPGKIGQYVQVALSGGNGDDGLLQRFGLTVWPDVNGPWSEVDRLPDKAAREKAFAVFDHLDALDVSKIGAYQDTDSDGRPEGISYLRFSEDGLILFREWRSDLEQKLRSGDLHPALEAHLAKYRKLVPGLALILHLSEGNSGPVTYDATLRALAWSDYLESHARRLYASVISREVETASAILKKIASGALASPFASWNVWRAGWAGLTDREQVKVGLQLLVDFGWLRVVKRPTEGRTAEEYEINPKGVSR